MREVRTQHDQTFSKSIAISAPASAVWQALTNTTHMSEWMSEKGIEILTDWKPGSSIRVRGEKHWVPFENNGIVLRFEPESVLSYSHLSSLSRLPEKHENYSIIQFILISEAESTTVTVELRQFPTESIQKHLCFYWGVTLTVLKDFVEKRAFLKA